MITISMVNTKAIARYFPNTTFPTDTGAVKINWSVLLWRSSAKLRIVSTGTVISMINAIGVLVQLLGHAPSPEEIAEAVTAGERTRETLHKSAEDDRARDCSPAMAVGYGVDADSEEEKMQDYHTVRGIR